MKKTLLRRCQKPIVGQFREENMITVGKEMFGSKMPKRDIPMVNVGKVKATK